MPVLTVKKALYSLYKNAKFHYNNKKYTVFAIEANMVEVYDGVRFWAWPIHTVVDHIKTTR